MFRETYGYSLELVGTEYSRKMAAPPGSLLRATLASFLLFFASFLSFSSAEPLFPVTAQLSGSCGSNLTSYFFPPVSNATYHLLDRGECVGWSFKGAAFISDCLVHVVRHNTGNDPSWTVRIREWDTFREVAFTSLVHPALSTGYPSTQLRFNLPYHVLGTSTGYLLALCSDDGTATARVLLTAFANASASLAHCLADCHLQTQWYTPFTGALSGGFNYTCIAPSPSPTSSPSRTPSPTRTPTPSPTRTPTPTRTPSPTTSPTPSPLRVPDCFARALTRKRTKPEQAAAQALRNKLFTEGVRRDEPALVQTLSLLSLSALCDRVDNLVPFSARFAQRRARAIDPAQVRRTYSTGRQACPVVRTYVEVAFEAGTPNDAIAQWRRDNLAALRSATHYGVGVRQVGDRASMVVALATIEDDPANCPPRSTALPSYYPN